MSRLHPSLMVLDKGLNLQAPKILAPEGSVLDSLNYEQVDFQGQKRIDGYARYDGSVLSAFDDFVVIEDSSTWELGTDGRNLAYNVETGNLFGMWLDNLDGGDAFVMLDETSIPEGWEWGKNIVTDVTEHYELLLSFQGQVRAMVESLPGAIIGLHWFRDRLYAVADLRALQLDDAEADVKPNDLLIVGEGTVIGSVLDSVKISGNLYVLVDVMTSLDSITIDRNGNTYTVTEHYAGVAATFWEARTEQQVLDEDGPSGPYDFGWKFNHLGWSVPFREGNSLYGSLTSLNQNRQGVGVQGPTSIAGDSGKPLVLTQKVNISNLPAQVNGWKTSTSPNVYSLEADALDDVDSVTIYADAYFSWDGTTGVVSAPGITGEGMIEYPATNTVVVDV